MAKNSGGTRSSKTLKVYNIGGHKEYKVGDIFKNSVPNDGVSDYAVREIGQEMFMFSGGMKMNVNINNIYPTQETVKVSAVNEYKAKSGEGIQGVKVGEKVYIFDGHHRAAAQILNKKKTIQINIVEVSKSKFEKKKMEAMEEFGWM